MLKTSQSILSRTSFLPISSSSLFPSFPCSTFTILKKGLSISPFLSSSSPSSTSTSTTTSSSFSSVTNAFTPTEELPIFYKSDQPYVKPSKRPVPPPRGLIQDVPSFLHSIGRDSISFASKFTSWDMLFTSDSRALKKLGLTTKQRKYLLLHVERYRQGLELCEIIAGRWPKRDRRTITHKKQSRVK